MCVRNNIKKIVACLPITKDGNILLINEFRIPVNENTPYSLSYAQFVVPLVKAVQEQQKMIEELKKEIEELKCERNHETVTYFSTD